jgi:transcriptional regulator of nitric oxide reductase
MQEGWKGTGDTQEVVMEDTQVVAMEDVVVMGGTPEEAMGDAVVATVGTLVVAMEDAVVMGGTQAAAMEDVVATGEDMVVMGDTLVVAGEASCGCRSTNQALEIGCCTACTNSSVQYE